MCNGRSSVCTESVHSSVSRCACSTGDHCRFKCTSAYKQLNKVGRTTGLNLCSMHLMSLHPSVGFMCCKPLSRITVWCVGAYPSIHVALRITVVPCLTLQQLVQTWCVEVLGPPIFLIKGGTPRTTQQHLPKGIDASSAYATKEGKMCRTWSCCRLYSTQVKHKDTRYGGKQFYTATFVTLLGHDLTQVSVNASEHFHSVSTIV